MTTAKVDRDDCPVPSCDEDVSLCLITTEATKLTTQNLTHERTCITPTTHDGEPAVYLVYHAELAPPEERLDTPDREPDAEDTEDPDSDDDVPRDVEGLVEMIDDAEPPDPDDLDGAARTVYDRLAETTAAGNATTKSSLAGRLITDDIAPSACDDIVDVLVEDGYAIETEDGIRAVTG